MTYIPIPNGPLERLLKSGEDWGYNDARRNHYQRLWKDWDGSQKESLKVVEPPGWLDVALSLEREQRILTEMVVNLRRSHIQKERTQGEY